MEFSVLLVEGAGKVTEFRLSAAQQDGANSFSNVQSQSDAGTALSYNAQMDEFIVRDDAGNTMTFYDLKRGLVNTVANSLYDEQSPPFATGTTFGSIKQLDTSSGVRSIWRYNTTTNLLESITRYRPTDSSRA